MKGSVFFLAIIVLIAVSFFLRIPQNFIKKVPGFSKPGLCTRTKPYLFEPEFERAISLIIQRLNQGTNQTYLDENFQSIKNCLYVSYSSDVDKYDAEGLFYFDEKSTKNKLNILVSNKYRANDDILTAMLLTHEISHAYDFVRDTQNTCYEQEAEAFYNQGIFFSNLNKAEKDSIIARSIVGESSEISGWFEIMKQVVNLKDYSAYDAHLRIVQSNPYYQKQCARN